MAWIGRARKTLRQLAGPDSLYMPPGQNNPIGSIKAAWSGGCVGQVAGKDCLLSFGGGHGDSLVNGMSAEYADGVTETEWVSPPTMPPNIPNPPVAPWDPYPTDGRPCSRHSYSGVAYVPWLNAVWCTGGSRWDGGGLRTAWLFHLARRQWERLLDMHSPWVEGTCDVDTEARVGYVNCNTRISRYDFSLRAYTKIVEHASLGELDPAVNFVFDSQRKWFISAGPRNGRRTNPVQPFMGNPTTQIRYVNIMNPSAGNQWLSLTGDTTWLEIEGVSFAKHPNGKYYPWSGMNHVWEVDLDARTSRLLPLEPWPAGFPLPSGDSVKRGRYHAWGWSSQVNGFIGSPGSETHLMIYTLDGDVPPPATKPIDTAGGIIVEVS
jgi:hypothetical protein